MKQSNDEYVFDKEAFVARLMAIGTKPKAKPVPTAQEKAQEAFKPTLERVLQTEKQTCEQALKAKEEALREAQERRARDEYVQRQRQITESTVELRYAAQQAEALAARRYDPTGNWGSPNYRRLGEEW